MEPVFNRGNHTLRVPMTLFADNRRRLMERLKAKPEVENKRSFVVLQGGSDVHYDDTDVSWPFKQVSIFFPSNHNKSSISEIKILLNYKYNNPLLSKILLF